MQRDADGGDIALDHADASVTGLVYNHSAYLPQMREALDLWAEKLRAIIASSDEEAVAA